MDVISCIYTITNKINGKMYIGYTKDFYSRRWQHFSLLKSGIHHSGYLQNAVNKYGIENFCMEVLEEYPEELLIAIEHYWCNIFNTFNVKYGYNIKPTNPSTRFGKIALSTRSRMSEARMGSKLGEETKIKIGNSNRGKLKPWEIGRKFIATRQIYQINPDTLEVIKCWESACQAARELGLNRGNMATYYKKGWKVGGYIWKYKEDLKLNKS